MDSKEKIDIIGSFEEIIDKLLDGQDDFFYQTEKGNFIKAYWEDNLIKLEILLKGETK